MPDSIIDSYAEKHKAAFSAAISAGELEALPEFQRLLDVPLWPVKTLTGVTDRRCRVALCHEQSLILGTHSNEMMRIDLDAGLEDLPEGTSPPTAWKRRELPGRVLSCCIAKRKGKTVVVGCLETGHCVVVNFDTGKRVETFQLSGNLLGVTVVPLENLAEDSKSFENEILVHCAHTTRALHIVTTSGQRLYTRAIEHVDGAPRSCFFVNMPSSHERRLVVLLDSGKLLSFDVYISISKTTKPVRSIRVPTIA